MASTAIRKITSPKWDMFDLFVVVAFAYSTVLSYFTAIFIRIPLINVVGDKILPVTVAIFAVFCFLGGYFRKVKVSGILIVFALLLIIMVSLLIYPTNMDYLGANLSRVLVKAIPFFLLGLCIRTNIKTVKNLTYISYLAILLAFLYKFFYKGSLIDYGYDMNQAYGQLPHVLFAINSIFNRDVVERKIISIPFSLLGFVFLLGMGTRGPILIAIVFFAVKLFLVLDKKKLGTLFFFTMIVGGIVVLFASGYYLTLLENLSKFLSSYGMSTRVIDMFLENEYLSNTSGRDKIFELLWGKVLENPLGYGAFGEWQFVGYSAHNIYLQLCVHYGLVFGPLLIIGYLYLALKSYFKSGNRYAKELILMFFVFTVVRGIFGGDYFSDHFFFLFGLAINELRAQHSAKRYAANKAKNVSVEAQK